MKCINTKRRCQIIITLLTLLIIIASLSITTFSAAATDDEAVIPPTSDFVYSYLTDGTVSITSYKGKAANIIIPAQINGYDVSTLNKAFYMNKIVESVIVPETVKAIKNNPFYSCSKLKSITIKGEVLKYENYPFWDLPALEYVELASSELSINMSARAFNNCPKLKEVVLPKGLDTLYNETFYECPKLERIYVPDTVSYIFRNAFGDVTSMYTPKFTIISYESAYIKQFCEDCNYPYVGLSELYKAPELNTVSLKSGSTYSSPIKPENERVLNIGNDSTKINYTATYSSSNSKVAKIASNGTITALNKGTATITVKVSPKIYPSYKQSYSFKVNVTTAPALSKTSISVKKGKTVTVKLTGKAKAINNAYSNTAYAKFTSAKNATSLKIKGLKKGSTTVKVKVNGVKTLSIKVKVK